VKEALVVLGDVTRTALDAGLRVRAYVSTVFGCPYEGAVDPERVASLVRDLIAPGPTK